MAKIKGDYEAFINYIESVIDSSEFNKFYEERETKDHTDTKRTEDQKKETETEKLGLAERELINEIVDNPYLTEKEKNNLITSVTKEKNKKGASTTKLINKTEKELKSVLDDKNNDTIELEKLKENFTKEIEEIPIHIMSKKDKDKFIEQEIEKESKKKDITADKLFKNVKEKLEKKLKEKKLPDALKQEQNKILENLDIARIRAENHKNNFKKTSMSNLKRIETLAKDGAAEKQAIKKFGLSKFKKDLSKSLKAGKITQDQYNAMLKSADIALDEEIGKDNKLSIPLKNKGISPRSKTYEEIKKNPNISQIVNLTRKTILDSNKINKVYAARIEDYEKEIGTKKLRDEVNKQVMIQTLIDSGYKQPKNWKNTEKYLSSLSYEDLTKLSQEKLNTKNLNETRKIAIAKQILKKANISYNQKDSLKTLTNKIEKNNLLEPSSMIIDYNKSNRNRILRAINKENKENLKRILRANNVSFEEKDSLTTLEKKAAKNKITHEKIPSFKLVRNKQKPMTEKELRKVARDHGLFYKETDLFDQLKNVRDSLNSYAGKPLSDKDRAKYNALKDEYIRGMNILQSVAERVKKNDRIYEGMRKALENNKWQKIRKTDPFLIQAIYEDHVIGEEKQRKITEQMIKDLVDPKTPLNNKLALVDMYKKDISGLSLQQKSRKIAGKSILGFYYDWGDAVADKQIISLNKNIEKGKTRNKDDLVLLGTLKHRELVNNASDEQLKSMANKIRIKTSHIDANSPNYNKQIASLKKSLEEKEQTRLQTLGIDSLKNQLRHFYPAVDDKTYTPDDISLVSSAIGFKSIGLTKKQRQKMVEAELKKLKFDQKKGQLLLPETERTNFKNLIETYSQNIKGLYEVKDEHYTSRINIPKTFPKLKKALFGNLTEKEWKDEEKKVEETIKTTKDFLTLMPGQNPALASVNFSEKNTMIASNLIKKKTNMNIIEDEIERRHKKIFNIPDKKLLTKKEKLDLLAMTDLKAYMEWLRTGVKPKDLTIAKNKMGEIIFRDNSEILTRKVKQDNGTEKEERYPKTVTLYPFSTKKESEKIKQEPPYKLISKTKLKFSEIDPELIIRVDSTLSYERDNNKSTLDKLSKFGEHFEELQQKKKESKNKDKKVTIIARTLRQLLKAEEIDIKNDKNKALGLFEEVASAFGLKYTKPELDKATKRIEKEFEEGKKRLKKELEELKKRNV